MLFDLIRKKMQKTIPGCITGIFTMERKPSGPVVSAGSSWEKDGTLITDITNTRVPVA